MMDMFLELAPTGILQGLVLGIIALGILIPFRLMNLPDLTGEGAYSLGAIFSCVLLIFGFPPLVSILFGCVAGGLLGVATAILYLRFKVGTLLGGIILSTMVYSINLRLMGKPNMAIFEYKSLFSKNLVLDIAIVALCLISTAAVLLLFLKTEKGLRFRTIGLNSLFGERQSINLNSYTMLGFFISNALCAFSGSLMVQIQGYGDINMGIGIVIHALAALMIGEVILGTQSLQRQLAAPILGALIYQQIQGFALTLGLAPSDLKFLTGSMILSVIVFSGKKNA